MERTLILIKPDAVARGLVGRIIQRFEDKGLTILGLKQCIVDAELAEAHYAVHKGKPFYEPLLEFITAGPLTAVVVEGIEAIAVVRTLVGPTFGREAPPGTIRGDFGMSKRFNLIHASDSPEAADEEIRRFFQPGELAEEQAPRAWIYDDSGDELV